MKKSIILGFVGAVITLLLSLGFSDLFHAWELKTLDARFQVRGSIETNPNIIMIDADDASAQQLGRWPWPRSLHTQMINFLSNENPGVIVYDILFSQPVDEAEERLLAQATKKSGGMVYPFAASLINSDKALGKVALPEYFPVTQFKEAPGTKNYLSIESAILPLPGLVKFSRGLGHIAANRDRDGVIRRTPLFVRHEEHIVPSLALQAVLTWLDVSPEQVEINDSKILLKQASLPGNRVDIQIPVDSNGQMLINYAGKWSETFKHASFASVLANDEKTTGNMEEVEGKLILVSNTLSGQDIKSTPIEKDYPGSGIHANIINTIVTQNFLRETGQGFNALLILLLSITTARLLLLRKYLLQAVFISTLLAGYLVACGVFFNSGLVLQIVSPLCTIILTGLLVSIYQAGSEKKLSDNLQQEKNRVESHLVSISVDLAVKEGELKKIQDQLRGLQTGMQIGQERGQEQALQIDDLQRKLQLLVQDKEELLVQRNQLEDKVLDLRVHISFDPSGEEILEPLKQECGEFGINTRSQSVLEVFKNLKQVAPVPSPVLILGDSGTGKELFAKALHLLSDRKGEFVPVNMGAIPEGLYESELFGHMKGSFTGAVTDKKGKFAQASEGTIFLDEIGEIRQDLQVKLLRVLQEKEVQPVGGKAIKVDVRIVAATNKDLQKEIEGGEFRQDLFYRLNTVTLKLPPLKDRREDIEILVEHLIKKYCAEYGKDIQGISDKAMRVILDHDWPGNIRELENIIQRGITFATGELIQEKDLGMDQAKAEVKRPLLKASKAEGDELLLNALRENNFEINQTATRLKMHRNTVTARFKGICFDMLVRHGMDDAVKEIAEIPSHYETVMQMLSEYWKNLINTVEEFETEAEAIKAALKRNKNVPAQYHGAIEELVRVHCEGKEKSANS
ncbi:MAG: sigma 54-interacting transcriptional regulator [Nitrospina sp.]|jgi:transcriptional regulator with PAS, ATPase and Fis domain/CHASE2 domain-containing sensor protein|nr:sigma 54-interacting transcriptional regulator [Nitrospina sp.]MBT3874789.1 sigma 54-interacting transcriptional regulator [Nitrospina sp.]MBT4557122.1 sigma 54-interacting transcriptional regulator [Nitrospina sp.]MBT5349794.1 sigma 54-interacting transcriptional regulator [Nitrospina sp.]MBT6249960.1 sigma 54-interacting transcriptional regulator [Nitrospina sp.]